MITVVLADDHKVLLEGLQLLLGREKDIQVLGTATNGQEAVEQIIRLQPDVAVLDISMPFMDGIDATQQIGEHRPQTKVLILSMYHSYAYVQRARRAGAMGYILKDAAGEELVQAVRTLHQGNRYFGDKLSAENGENSTGNHTNSR